MVIREYKVTSEYMLFLNIGYELTGNVTLDIGWGHINTWHQWKLQMISKIDILPNDTAPLYIIESH
jgi:hypothetical protein